MFIPLINDTCTIEKVPFFAKVEDDQDNDHEEKKRSGEKCAESVCHCHSPVLAAAKCVFY